MRLKCLNLQQKVIHIPKWITKLKNTNINVGELSKALNVLVLVL